MLWDEETTDSLSTRQLLIAAWRDETCSPVLLPFQTQLVDSAIQAIGTDLGEVSVHDAAFSTLIKQLDVERTKFVGSTCESGWQRHTTTHSNNTKISAFHQHTLTEAVGMMSPEESAYCNKQANHHPFNKRFKQIADKAMDKLVYSQFPAEFVQQAEPGTVVKPNLDNAVYIKVQEDIGDYVLDARHVFSSKPLTRSRNITSFLEEGKIYAVRFSYIQQLLKQEQVKLHS